MVVGASLHSYRGSSASDISMPIGLYLTNGRCILRSIRRMRIDPSDFFQHCLDNSWGCNVLGVAISCENMQQRIEHLHVDCSDLRMSFDLQCILLQKV